MSLEFDTSFWKVLFPSHISTTMLYVICWQITWMKLSTWAAGLSLSVIENK